MRRDHWTTFLSRALTIQGLARLEGSYFQRLESKHVNGGEAGLVLLGSYHFVTIITQSKNTVTIAQALAKANEARVT